MAYPDVEGVLRLVETGQRDAVVDLIVEATEDEGVDVAVELVAAVQVEVGHRWHTAAWTVSHEHMATAILDLALAVATAAAGRAQASSGTVVVVCAEEEWHVVPARMVAAQLEARGLATRFLGASLPADHLAAYLHRNPVDAVAISCTVPLHLVGARRLVSAAHSAGTPVIIGGRATGRDPVRAAAIGADGWATTADDAHRILRSWSATGPTLRAPRVDATEWMALAADRVTIVHDAMAELARTFPPMRDYSPGQVERTREDFDYIVRFLEASLIVGDDRIFLEFIPWLVACLEPRGVPRHAVRSALTILDAVTTTEHTGAHDLLRLGLEALALSR